MEIINIYDIKENMILAENIYNNNGDLIVEKGESLNSDIILTLIRSGVDKIAIDNDKKKENFDNTKIDNHQLFRKYNVSNIEDLKKAIASELKDRFRNVMDNVLMRNIYNKSIKYKYKSLGIK